MAGLPLTKLVLITPDSRVRTHHAITVFLIHTACQGVGACHVQPQEAKASIPKKAFSHFKHKTAQSLVAKQEFYAERKKVCLQNSIGKFTLDAKAVI